MSFVRLPCPAIAHAARTTVPFIAGALGVKHVANQPNGSSRSTVNWKTDQPFLEAGLLNLPPHQKEVGKADSFIKNPGIHFFQGDEPSPNSPKDPHGKGPNGKGPNPLHAVLTYATSVSQGIDYYLRDNKKPTPFAFVTVLGASLVAGLVPAALVQELGPVTLSVPLGIATAVKLTKGEEITASDKIGAVILGGGGGLLAGLNPWTGTAASFIAASYLNDGWPGITRRETEAARIAREWKEWRAEPRTYSD